MLPIERLHALSDQTSTHASRAPGDQSGYVSATLVQRFHPPHGATLAKLPRL